MAILGRPNVGKSSLLNALLRSDRAIVTPIPGTTRDLLEEVVSIHGIPVRLFDTAGIRASDDPVEAEGIRRSHLAWEDADLALILLDGSQPLMESDRLLLRRQEAAQALLVVNKCDLPSRISECLTIVNPRARGRRRASAIWRWASSRAGFCSPRSNCAYSA